MSELKVYHHELRPGEYSEFYLKSEVDKVIENRDAEIARLKDSIGKLLKVKTEQVMDEVFQKCLIYGEGFVPVEHAMRIIAKLRHSNYKRCLAMAWWCEVEAHRSLTEQSAIIDFPEIDRFQYLQWNFTHFSRWHRRWLELAEKFKEAK